MRMVRKQVYITTEQDERLKRLARDMGVTEADLLRRALDAMQAVEYSTGASAEGLAVREAAAVGYRSEGREAAGTGSHLDNEAWLEELAFIEERAKSGVGSTEKWSHDESYDRRRLRLPD